MVGRQKVSGKNPCLSASQCYMNTGEAETQLSLTAYTGLVNELKLALWNTQSTENESD